MKKSNQKQGLVWLLILSVNTAITATHLWEHNQKDYNQVWLEMTASDQTEPDSLQTITLLGVAYQCPYAGGEAVYQARALLGEGYTFNDAGLCSPPQAYIRKKADTFGFTAFPNPGQHFVTVELEDNASTDGQVLLTDLLGRVVQVQAFAKGDQQAILLLESVPAGMYHLTVEMENKSSTRLFSIVK